MPSIAGLSVYTLGNKGLLLPSILTLGHWDPFTIGNQCFAYTQSGLGFAWRGPNGD